MPSRSPDIYESVIRFLAEDEAARQRALGRRVLAKSYLLRWLAEPVFGAAGILLGRLLNLAPAASVLRLHNWGFRVLRSSRVYPWEGQERGVEAARALCRELSREFGGEPALVGIFSHPRADEEMLPLSADLTRAASDTLWKVRDLPCRPRLLVATDPMAVDMLPLPVEAFYAGLMEAYHLGLERWTSARSPAGRWMFAGSHWSRAGWKLLGLLRRRGEVVFALAGGVDYTTRVLYSGRELLRRLCVPKSADLEVVRALVGRAGGPGSAGGRVPPPALELIREAAGRSAERGGDLERELGRFEEEFARETPYRLRLWKILVRRLVQRGIPLVLIPIAHTRQRPFRVRWMEPQGLGAERGGAAGDSVRVFRFTGGGVRSGVERLEAWAAAFVGASFF